MGEKIAARAKLKTARGQPLLPCPDHGHGNAEVRNARAQCTLTARSGSATVWRVAAALQDERRGDGEREFLFNC